MGRVLCVFALLAGLGGPWGGCRVEARGSFDVDAGWPCGPECGPPFQCDPETGECFCPEGECCWVGECYCVAGERSCDGDDIVVCEHREIEPQDGICGTECDHPVVSSCEQGCGYVGTGRPYCMEDLCDVYPEERYSFSVVTSDGEAYGCEELELPGQELSFELTGDASRLDDGRFVIVGVDGRDATVLHDVGPDLMACAASSSDVALRATYRMTENGFCDAQLVVTAAGSASEVILLVRDGGWMDLGVGWWVDRLDVGCPFGSPGPCGDALVRVLQLWLWDQDPLYLLQGQTGYSVYDDELYRVRNLRSFESGECDDDTTYAFAVARVCAD